MATLHATPVRFGAASWLLPVRATVVTVVGLGLLLLLVAIDLSVGDFPIPLGDVVRTLLGGGDAGQRFIVMELRLPQTMAAVAVGAALGLAGALTQTLARNPLASPDILGVTEGAAFAAVLVIVASGASGYGGGLVTGRLQELGLPLAAFTGAMVTAALLYLFSWRRGLDVQRLVLVGIGLGATLTAGTSYLLVNSRIQDAASAQIWLSGSLTARGWEHVPSGAAHAGRPRFRWPCCWSGRSTPCCSATTPPAAWASGSSSPSSGCWSWRSGWRRSRWRR